MEHLSFLQSENLEIFIRLFFQVILFVMSAFFSGSETALFSLNRMDMQNLRTSRNPYSDKIHEMLDEPRKLIVSILCGNELVNIASSANMAAILISTVGEEDATWVNMVIMVPMLLLFGEVTPKTIAVTFPIRWAAGLSGPLLPKWIKLITPLRDVVRLAAEFVTTLIAGKAEQRSNILDPDEFHTLVEYSEATGIIDATERVLIDNMMDAARTEVVDIMTPRTRTKFIYADMPFPEIVHLFQEYQHPRIPVIRTYKDNVQGMLHSEDVVRLIQEKADLENIRLEDVMRPAHFVPPTKQVDEMFDYFQEHHTRAVIILSEDGGVMGVVTMKDVLNFTFGGLDGVSRSKRIVEDAGQAHMTLSGDMRLMDFYYMTNLSIPNTRMTTVAGYAFQLFGRLPKEGESVSREGITFTVLEMEERRIKTLRVLVDALNNTEEGISTDPAVDPDDMPHQTKEESIASDGEGAPPATHDSAQEN